MQRLYFLTPNAASTHAITHELNQLGIGRHAIHVVCRNQKLLDRMALDQATVRQTTDVVNAAKRGALFGALAGAVAGIVAAYVLPVSETDGILMTIAGLILIGALFGIWSSTLVGVSVPDVKVKKFEKQIAAGHFLMLVDIPEARMEEIQAIIRRHHPEAQIETVSLRERQHAEGIGA